jgi:ADP-ribose pyrophosphatase YjhB (NUDIX family)
MEQFVQFAQKAFIVKNNMFLIVQKSSKDKLQGGKWEVPGGKKEIGEDLDAHIKREVFEEVGLKIIPKEPFGLWSFAFKKDSKEVEVIVVARICELDGSQKIILEDQINNAQWVDIDFSILNKYEFIENMKPTLKQFLGSVHHRKIKLRNQNE